jgi:ligand-binding sensor domain-containing protein
VYLKDGRSVPIAGVPERYVRDVVEDAPGSLWVSHDQGLLHLVDGRVAERIPWSRLGHKDYAYSLRPDPARGGLWLGFSQGGLAFFKDNEVRESWSASDGLGKGLVGRFQIDGDGTLWAATEGGLSRLKNGRIATLTSANGLPCDAVCRVIEDDDHSIWLGTSCGLARIARTELDAWANDSKRTVRVTVLDSSDGLIGPPLGGRVTKSTDGKLWFGTPGAVAVIDPRHLPFNKLSPPVHVERVVADRTAYGVTSGLRLPPLVRDLEIEYTPLAWWRPSI